MEISNANNFMPVPGIDQAVANMDKQRGHIEQFNRHTRRDEKIVFIGYRPRYNENTYGPYGKSRNYKITTGEIIDIYI